MKLDTNLLWLRDRIIYLVRHGSWAYGTNTEGSDLDLRGVCIPPLPYFFGFMNRFEQAQVTTPDSQDCVIHDIRKFVKSAADANPNMLELLFVAPEDQLILHPLMAMLVAKRDLFLSQKVAYTFSGYAISQLRKLERSRLRPPERVNPVRAEMIKEFGYDCKDASHVVRLLRMGTEILNGKGVIVKRPDAEELLHIRHGGWTLDQVLEYAGQQEKAMMAAKESTKLPVAPDRVTLDKLTADIVEASFGHRIQMPIMDKGFKSLEMTFGLGNLTDKKLSETE